MNADENRNIEGVKDCVKYTHKALLIFQEASSMAGRDMEAFKLRPCVVEALESSFTFLVERNGERYHDKELLDAGCKVWSAFNGITLSLPVVEVEMVKIRFDAFLGYCVLLIDLFLAEVNNGTIVLGERDRDIDVGALREFLESVDANIAKRVLALEEVAWVYLPKEAQAHSIYH